MKINIKDTKPDSEIILANQLPYSQNAEQDIKEPTEMSEAMKEMNIDVIDPNSKMSSIDTKTRLISSEISAITSIDALVNLRVLPQKCLGITRQHKRLAISKNGLGRTEMVSLASGVKQDDIQKSSGFNLSPKSWFKKDEK